MANPFMVAGGFLEVGGAIAGAKIKSALAKSQAQWALRKGEATRDLAEVEASEFRKGARFRRGQISGGFAVAGVVVDTGSAIDVRNAQLETDIFTELRMVHAAELQAAGFQLDANVAKFRKDAAITEGIFKAFSGAVKMAGGLTPGSQ